MDVCLRMLKESSKSRSDSYSVRNSVLVISHITFRDCRVHIFPNNFSQNSVILEWTVLFWPRLLKRWLSPPGECWNFGAGMCHWDSGTMSRYQTFTQGRLFLFGSYKTEVHILFSLSGRLLRTSQQSLCTSSSACTLPFLLIKYAVVIPREFWEISWRRAIPWPAVFYSKGKRQSPWWYQALWKDNPVSNKVACNAYIFLWASESCLSMFVMLWSPSLIFSLRKIGESRNNNPCDRCWGETKWRVSDKGEKNT